MLVGWPAGVRICAVQLAVPAGTPGRTTNTGSGAARAKTSAMRPGYRLIAPIGVRARSVLLTPSCRWVAVLHHGGMAEPRTHRDAVDAAWAAYGDGRTIEGVEEVSANVSTNRVYRLFLDDGTTLITKVSSYGSYFLFVEHHGTHRIGTDLQSFGQVLVFKADVGEGGEFRLGGDQRPDHHGDREREQFPAEILEQQIADPFERRGITDAPARPAVCGWRQWSAGYRRRNPRSAGWRAAARRSAD